MPILYKCLSTRPLVCFLVFVTHCKPLIRVLPLSQGKTSYFRSWNLCNKLALYFSTSTSSEESGVELIIAIAPALCKASAAWPAIQETEMEKKIEITTISRFYTKHNGIIFIEAVKLISESESIHREPSGWKHGFVYSSNQNGVKDPMTRKMHKPIQLSTLSMVVVVQASHSFYKYLKKHNMISECLKWTTGHTLK